MYQSILDLNTQSDPGEKHLAALTAGDRIPWAKARKQYFRHGINKVSLDTIERAAFVLILDDDEVTYDEKDESKLDHWAHVMLHGKGYDRWFDKSFNIIVCKNGRTGINGEHSWADAPILSDFDFASHYTDLGVLKADAPIMSQVMEYMGFYDVMCVRADAPISSHLYEQLLLGDRITLRADAPISSHLYEYTLVRESLAYGYTDDGHTVGYGEQFEQKLPPVTKLNWDIPEECQSVIQSSLRTAETLLNNVDMALVVFQEFGKGAVKKFKVSPDGFLQMALQLTYFRDQGKFMLTYESSMTRLFREGRTETVRTVTGESCAFVRAMESTSSTDEERRELLRNACRQHQVAYRDAMCGKGVDRHLFALYVVSRYLEVDSPFLSTVLMEPWRLSSSQTPHQQTELVDLSKHPECISAGGGFGPVADDGYGVSYIIAGENTVSFHISSKIDCPSTSSKRFRETLRRSLRDMKGIFDAEMKSNAV